MRRAIEMIDGIGDGHTETLAVPQPILPPLFVDAFAGCGGLSLGLMRAGWRGLFAIEKDPFAFDTLSTNFPCGDGPLSYVWPADIGRRAWDIRELLAKRSERLAAFSGKVDLLAGGPPCQGFSQAGRRRPDDPRNKLFEAYLELVGILSPRLVLIENVLGFQSDFKGTDRPAVRNFAATLQEGLGAHYYTARAVIWARNFGVPQARPRLFLIGALKNTVSADRIATFFEDLENRTNDFLSARGLPRRPTTRDAISDLEVSRNGTVPSADTTGFEAIAYKSPRTPYQRVMRRDYKGAPPDTRLARHRPAIRERFAALIRSCQEEGRLNVAISPETRTEHNLKKTAIRVLDPLNSAPTITSLPDDLLHYSEPRTLTVRENARLQSFPDWFAFKGNYTTGGHRRRKETPRFTQVANAVPPLLAEQLGAALLRIVSSFRSSTMLVEGCANQSERTLVRSQFQPESRHPAIVNDHRFTGARD